jgi:superfamily I DNA and/or RNA helicase
VRTLCRELQRDLVPDVLTVDSAQGREAAVVLLSTVRTSSRSLGFVADERRLNVSLTRAQSALWIVGRANALRGQGAWGDLMNFVEKKKLIQKQPL